MASGLALGASLVRQLAVLHSAFHDGFVVDAVDHGVQDDLAAEFGSGDAEAYCCPVDPCLGHVTEFDVDSSAHQSLFHLSSRCFSRLFSAQVSQRMCHCFVWSRDWNRGSVISVSQSQQWWTIHVSVLIRTDPRLRRWIGRLTDRNMVWVRFGCRI